MKASLMRASPGALKPPMYMEPEGRGDAWAPEFQSCLLYTSGYDHDLKMMKYSPNIDVILGGHTHVMLPHGHLRTMLRAVKGWLYTEPDRYHEITDSYDSLYLRYAVISGSRDIEDQLNKVGCFTAVSYTHLDVYKRQL